MKYWLLTITSIVCLTIFSIGCKNSQKTTQTEEQFMKDKIIVLIKEGFQPRKLEAVFEDYELKTHGQMSRTENRFIMVYNINKIKPEEMLEKLRNAKIVIEAAFAPITKLDK
ncbi:MAG: hypothetical protein NXI23_22485 [Bacteroidetes bacterium]|jgi:hypothetical protein|nr:hypothetical protein [Bacteroidota bacterium]